MTAYRRRFYRITASALVGAMGITGIAATASVASPSSVVAAGVSSTTSASVGATTAAGPGVAAGTSVAVQVPGPAAGGSATTLGVVGTVIKALKAIPKLWNAAVEKVKAGYRAFKSWWDNSVPQWIKNLLTGVTIYDIYQEIRNLIGL